jgi:hypothetical protein
MTKQSKNNFILENKEVEKTESAEIVPRVMKELVKYEKNPFMGKLVEEIVIKDQKVRAGKSGILIDKETNEEKVFNAVYAVKKVDRAKFVKIYTSEISALFELPKSATHMFAFVTSILEVGKDWVYIHYPEAMEFCGYKHANQVREGIKHLVGCGLLAASMRPNFYFINPQIFFNGDRALLVKEYQIENKSTPQEWADAKTIKPSDSWLANEQGE